MYAVPPPDGPIMARDLVKTSIRRLDARPVFVAVCPEPLGLVTTH